MLICTSITTRTTQKSYKRWMVETIIRGDKKGRPKDAQHARTMKKKREKELVPLAIGSYLTHGPSNVSHMQIITSNSNVKFCTCQTLLISTISELSSFLLLCVGFVNLLNTFLNFFHLFLNSL